MQGAVLGLQGGYSGFGDDAFLTASAVISDEFYYGDTFTTRNAADSRNLQPPALGNISDAAFRRLQTARVQARRAFAQILKFTTVGTAGVDSVNAARMRTVEGYAYVTLSEGWCGSVPFSIVPDSGTIDPVQLQGGPALTTREMNDTAIIRFNEALQYNPNSSLAKIGKARALLNLGRFDDAAAAVAGVPQSYVYLFEHSFNSATENNPIAALQQNGRYGISNLEGGTTTDAKGATVALRPDLVDSMITQTNAAAAGLPFRAIRDPRIPYEPRPRCFTSSINCFLNDNYPTFATAVPLASGVEARLIVAEALYQQGSYSAMLDMLNALRANTTSLVAALYPGRKRVFAADTLGALPATSIADATTARATLFAERAYWLFNTGHRQGDLRRLAREPYSLATNKVFPSGPFFRAGSYGDDVAYPVPFQEINNPNFSPASCSTTTP